MRKANINGQSNLRKVDPNWFTGRTWMRSVSDVIGSEGHDMYHVHFESGSRTKLHRHNGNQILMATKGAGSLEVFERRGGGTKSRFAIRRAKTIALSTGDVVHIPAGVLHAHGSVDKRKTFSHVAINAIPVRGGGGKYETVWYESDFERHVLAII